MTLLDPGSPADLGDRIARDFERAFGRSADAVGHAPGRVNLIGEHTDYNAGLCLPVALPHATYVAGALRSDGRVQVISRQSASGWTGHVDRLGPGEVTDWAAYVAGVLWALVEDGLDLRGVELAIDSTVPLGAGLSSSAAVECAVAAAVCGLLGTDLSHERRQRLVQACIRAETEVAGAPTGGMDQTVALHASAGAALLIDFDALTTTDVPLPLAEAGLALLVTDTRVSHNLTDGGYGQRRDDCAAAASRLGVVSLREAGTDQVEALRDGRLRRRARHVVSEIARVTEVVAAIEAGAWADLGPLFAASHASMRNDFEISCAELDTAVGTAVEAGAHAARMTGGGFGGSSVALVPEERFDAVVRAIDTAFAASGFRPPSHLRVEPSGSAGLL
ncbi:MAG: galactokinase [Nocardioides sp.]